MHDEYLRMKERVLKQLEGMAADSEQAKFLREELDLLNQKLGGLQGLSSSYMERYGGAANAFASPSASCRCRTSLSDWLDVIVTRFIRGGVISPSRVSLI